MDRKKRKKCHSLTHFSIRAEDEVTFRLPKWLSGWPALGCLALTFNASAWAADSAKALDPIRQFRAAHERAILQEFMQLLAIPNVASDKPDIERNAQAIEAMMQRRRLAPRLLKALPPPGDSEG